VLSNLAGIGWVWGECVCEFPIPQYGWRLCPIGLAVVMGSGIMGLYSWCDALGKITWGCPTIRHVGGRSHRAYLWSRARWSRAAR